MQHALINPPEPQLQPEQEPDDKTTAKPEEKGAIGIALIVWLLGGSLGLVLLVFLLAKVF